MKDFFRAKFRRRWPNPEKASPSWAQTRAAEIWTLVHPGTAHRLLKVGLIADETHSEDLTVGVDSEPTR